MRRLMAPALIVMAQAAWAGNYAEGFSAYSRGDYETAATIFQAEAERGDAHAQFNLGVMYDVGRGVAQNYKEAARWYRRAAEQGDSRGQFNLGVMYDAGRGVTQNYKEAARWYRLAAEQGDFGAQLNLGLLYGNGHGVKKDYLRAHMWLIIAAASGHSDGVNARDALAAGMTSEQIGAAQRMARECMDSNYKKCD